MQSRAYKTIGKIKVNHLARSHPVKKRNVLTKHAGEQHVPRCVLDALARDGKADLAHDTKKDLGNVECDVIRHR